MQRALYGSVEKKKSTTVAYLWVRQFFKLELNSERELYHATSPSVAFALTETYRINERRINLGNGQCQYCFDHFTLWIR